MKELNEMVGFVQESVERLHEVGAKGSKVIIADRYKEELIARHRKLMKCDPETICGLPLEFKDLPENLIVMVESEAEE